MRKLPLIIYKPAILHTHYLLCANVFIVGHLADLGDIFLASFGVHFVVDRAIAEYLVY